MEVSFQKSMLQNYPQPEEPNFSDFFEESPDIFILNNKDLKIISINKAGLKLFNQRKEEITGKSISEFFPFLLNNNTLEILHTQLKKRKCLAFDNVTEHAFLGTLFFAVKVFKVEENIGIILSDISRFKNTINDQYNFLEKSFNDLQGPIARILGLLNIAKIENKSLGLSSLISKIEDQAIKLDEFNNLLWTINRIKDKKITYFKINYLKLINKILNGLNCYEEYKTMDFRVSILSKENFYCDPSILEIILKKLVENAIKFRNENIDYSFVSIEISDEHKGIKIIVEDNGVGISSKFQNDLCRMFFRGSEKAGNGLGLYTANLCISKLEGKILFDSREKFGTRVLVYLPNSH